MFFPSFSLFLGCWFFDVWDFDVLLFRVSFAVIEGNVVCFLNFIFFGAIRISSSVKTFLGNRINSMSGHLDGNRKLNGRESDRPLCIV